MLNLKSMTNLSQFDIVIIMMQKFVSYLLLSEIDKLFSIDEITKTKFLETIQYVFDIVSTFHLTIISNFVSLIQSQYLFDADSQIIFILMNSKIYSKQFSYLKLSKRI